MLKKLFGKEDKGKVVQVKIGGVKVGIAGMGEIVETVGKMGLNSNEDLAREILKRVQAANYVPDAARDEYARDLLRFYKLRMGLPVEPLPYEGIPGVVEIKVLGPGCARCRQLEKDVRNLLGEINVAADLEKIEDMNEFAEYNVVVTPALVVNGLWALNLDPEAAARDYREQVIGPYRETLPKEVVASMEEQLSGSCTLEIATFSLFTSLLCDTDGESDYDHVVFDTAPTGHTLRLLALPKAWSGFLGENVHGASCIGPVSGLGEERQKYENAVASLSDIGLTTLFLVTRAEPSALAEAARTGKELQALGLTNQRLVINGVLTTTGEDRVAQAFKNWQQEALNQIPATIKGYPRLVVPLLPILPVGLARLRILAEQIREGRSEVTDPGPVQGLKAPAFAEEKRATTNAPQGLDAILADLGAREQGVVLVMGKGGVGKTTVAAAMALALAEQGHRVHLSTTDPAAHLEITLEGAQSGEEERLSVNHIDPVAEVTAYREEVIRTAGAEESNPR